MAVLSLYNFPSLLLVLFHVISSVYGIGTIISSETSLVPEPISQLPVPAEGGQNFPEVLECFNALKNREKELPFIYIDTKPVIRGFLESLIGSKNCLLILEETDAGNFPFTPNQTEELRKAYEGLLKHLVPTDLGF